MYKTNKDIEGYFNGQHMIAADGTEYPVSANYASKSMLVEGTRMVLKVQQDGKFVFKQIGVCPQKRIIAEIIEDENGALFAYDEKDGEYYKMLRASISYHKLEPQDKVSILIPLNAPAQWAAVENKIG
jgi:hypothetical protein